MSRRQANLCVSRGPGGGVAVGANTAWDGYGGRGVGGPRLGPATGGAPAPWPPRAPRELGEGPLVAPPLLRPWALAPLTALLALLLAPGPPRGPSRGDPAHRHHLAVISPATASASTSAPAPGHMHHKQEDHMLELRHT